MKQAIRNLNLSPMMGRSIVCRRGLEAGEIAHVVWVEAGAPDRLWVVWDSDGNEATPFPVTEDQFCADWSADFSWDMG